MAVSDIPRVLLLLDQGKSVEALELSSRLIEEMPTHVTSYVVHARANESQGQYEDAFRSWRQALDLMPNSPQIIKGLVRTADKLARPAFSDFDFMRWTRDKNQINVSQYQYAPGSSGKTVESELLSDPLVTDAARPPVEDDAADVPVFLDTDLPQSEEGYELDVAEGDPGSENFLIETAQEEQPIVVTSGEAPDFRPELDADVGTLPPEEPSEYATPIGDEVSIGDLESSSEMSAVETSERSGAGQPEPESPESNVTDVAADVAADAAAGVSADVSAGEDREARASEASTVTPLPDSMPGNPAKVATPMDDLDTLIGELESAKIVPRPENDPAPAPDLGNNVEGMVSETLARIYEAQNQHDESARIYEKLAALHPHRETEFLAKASEMRAKSS